MLTDRPPIVVILGHVDHGKTTLLDYLRQTKIAAGEAGGITQHIRSFVLNRKTGGSITFIDTPGHEAFSQMRRRGSNLADLALLVIAADDGVMPQTKQSITFIKETGIPFIVVINKTDLASSDIDKVKTQLAEENILVEDFGGQIPCASISAKTGKGISDLLELIDLLCQLNPPQADPDEKVELVVLESRMDSRKGPLTTVVVKQGTLTIGTPLFQSEQIGKAKAVLDSDGQNILTALPSSPVEILGLSIIPQVGSIISSSPIEIATSSSQSHPNYSPSKQHNFIIKADTVGSLEAILSGINQVAGVISSATGDVNENDVLLARTSNAQILSFNVRLSGSVAKLAETEKVPISSFEVIYKLFEFVEEIVTPKNTEQVVGKANVLADFKIDSNHIAGCKCVDGYIERSHDIKIIRNGETVGITHIKSLHQGKNNIEKVKLGMEFGAIFSPNIDFKPGDDIIATIG